MTGARQEPGLEHSTQAEAELPCLFGHPRGRPTVTGQARGKYPRQEGHRTASRERGGAQQRRYARGVIPESVSAG